MSVHRLLPAAWAAVGAMVAGVCSPDLESDQNHIPVQAQGQIVGAVAAAAAAATAPAPPLPCAACSRRRRWPAWRGPPRPRTAPCPCVPPACGAGWRPVDPRASRHRRARRWPRGALHSSMASARVGGVLRGRQARQGAARSLPPGPACACRPPSLLPSEQRLGEASVPAGMLVPSSSLAPSPEVGCQATAEIQPVCEAQDRTASPSPLRTRGSHT